MKNHFFISILTLLLSLMFGKGAYARTWVSLDGTKEEKPIAAEVLQSDLNGHKIRITIQGFNDDRIVKDGKEYHLPYLDMYEWLTYEGEPSLPTLHQTIAIPEGADIKVTITEEKWTDVEIGKIYPAQRNVKECDQEPPFTIKESVYQQDVYAPFLVTTGTEWNWCDIRGNTVHVCPFRYYPLENRLAVLTNFVIQIEFSECSDKSPVRARDIMRAIDWHIFDNDISSFPVKSDMEKSSPDDYDYLIIVGNIPSILNSQALQNFVKWKAFKGYKTKVVSTSTTGTSSSNIKNYITNESSKGIKYVLFIGDHDKIPLATVSSPVRTVKSDYWYGCLDGNYDYEADVSIGRFSVSTLAAFQNIVNKTISYESSYHGNYQKTLLVTHKENAPGKYQGCCESIRNETYTTPLDFNTAYGASVNSGGDEATNDSVINHINKGMHIINYRGHGDTYCWGYENNYWNVANELFTNNDVDNIDSCSIFFNVCCQNGNITEEPCLMEKLTHSENAAVACLAATEDSYTYPNHEFDKKLFAKLLNENVWHIGDLDVQAHIATFPIYNNIAKDNAYVYLCGGDPALEIWTGTPQHFNDVAIAKSNSGITVTSNSCSGFTVSVVSDNGALIEKINASGNSCTFTTPSGNCYAVLNKHNYFPYVIYCSNSGYIQNETLTDNRFYYNTPLNIGYDVTTEKPYGNVIVESGKKLFIQNGNNGVSIKNGFECKHGAEFIIN